MNHRLFLLAGWMMLCGAPLFAAPGLMNYQGRLTDAAEQPITSPVNVAFTFWDAESGGAQLGGGFSDMDAVTPDADGIYSTLIGDEPGNLVPESIFSGESVWLNVNVAGENLVPRVRIASVGYAIKSSKSDTATTATSAVSASNVDTVDSKHATDFAGAEHGHNLQDLSGSVTDTQVPNNITIDYAATAGTASGLSGALSTPGSRIALGTNVWLEVGTNGRVFLSANGMQFALAYGKWSNPAGISDNINPDSGVGTGNPRVAMDNNGNAIITYWEDDNVTLRVFMSEYRGGTWTHPSGLLNYISPGTTGADYPDVAMDNNGNAIIAWYQNDGSRTQIFKSEYRNGVWVHPSSLADNISPDGGNGAYNSHPAMDDNGNAIITWVQTDNSIPPATQIFKSEYHNGVWTHPGSLADNISPASNAYAPQVAMDNNGNAIIVWSQNYNTKFATFKSEYRNGVWTHPGDLADNISPDGQTVSAPKVAMDNNGNAIIVWQQSDGASEQIFKSEYRGGIWTHPGSLSDNISLNGQNAYYPKVAMDDNGNAIITWYQSDGTKQQIFKSEYRNGTWTHPSSISDNISVDGQDAQYPDVAMDNNGNAVIAWQQSNGTNIQIFKSEYQGGIWINPSGLYDNISPDGQSAASAKVAMDDNRNVIIVWTQSDGTYTQIYKSEYRLRF